MLGCSSIDAVVAQPVSDAAPESAQDAPAVDVTNDAVDALEAADEPEASQDATEEWEGCNLTCSDFLAECGKVPPTGAFCPSGLCCGLCPEGKWCGAENKCQDACPLMPNPPGDFQGTCVMMVDGKHGCELDGAVPLCPWDPVWNCYDCTASGC